MPSYDSVTLRRYSLMVAACVCVGLFGLGVFVAVWLVGHVLGCLFLRPC